jgi:hypothetical protein
MKSPVGEDVEPIAPSKSGWVRIQEIVWDGERSEEERKLVQKLDLFLMCVSLSETEINFPKLRKLTLSQDLGDLRVFR